MKINSIHTSNINSGGCRLKSGENNSFKASANMSAASFKGAGINKVLDGISNTYNKITAPLSDFAAGIYKRTAETKTFQNLVKKLSGHDSFKIIMIAESAFLSSCYAICDIRNKKIDKKQKPSLVLHDVITFAIGTAGALLLDDKISALAKKGAEKYIDKHQDFYWDLGKKTLERNNNKNLSELAEKAAAAAGAAEGNLSAELKNTAAFAENQLKHITGQNGRLKTFQVTMDKIKEFTNQLQNIILNFKDTVNTDGGAGLKDAVKKAGAELYQKAAARKEADTTIKGIGMLNKILVFGLMYRFLASILGTKFAVKLSSKISPENNNDKENKLKAAA